MVFIYNHFRIKTGKDAKDFLNGEDNSYHLLQTFRFLKNYYEVILMAVISSGGNPQGL